MAKRQLVGEAEFQQEYGEEATTTVIDIEPSSAKPVFEKKDGEVEVDIDDKPEKKQDKAESKSKPAADDIEIDIEDDTPPEDRGRKKSDPPEDPTDDELEEYSEKVRKRIKHFTKGYHDERREKERAARERDEAIAYARKLMEENNRLKDTGSKSQSLAIQQAKKIAEAEVAEAKRLFQAAYSDGDGEKLLDAQDKLTKANLKLDRISNLRAPSLQKPNNGVQGKTDYSDEGQPQQRRSEPQPQQQQPSVDPRAVEWAESNTWFGKDEEMTAFALGYHQKLVKEGVDTDSDEYYEKLNSRMQQVFPDQFRGAGRQEDNESGKRSESVVAPATRRTSPKRIKLTKTQVALAKKLGVPLEMYAKQVANEMRKAQND